VECRAILDYIENYEEVTAATEPAKPDEKAAEETHIIAEEEFMQEAEHPYGNIQLTFYISIILILIALFDLIATKLVKARFIHIIIILISVFVVGEILFVEGTNLGRQQYYEPDQPILFSHKVHAGQNQIDCQYCHFTAQESMHAGIPPVQLCMNCHNVIKNGTQTGTDEIAKINLALETGKPIAWVKVHNLPDHVYFNHAQHVKVGKVDCIECHGDVENMDRIKQVENLGMGWCIDCHRNTNVQFMDNDFYTAYTQLHEQMKAGDIKRVTVDNIGGNECQKCHY